MSDVSANVSLSCSHQEATDFVAGEKAWRELGLEISGSTFERENYAFQLERRPDDRSLFIPFQKITLRGNPSVTIPWSDPYLRKSWEHLLKGSKIGVQQARWDKTDERRFFFRDRLLFSLVFEEDKLRIRWHSVQGCVLQEANYPSPKDSPVVIDSSPQNTTSFGLRWHGRRLAVEAHFPSDLTPSRQYEALVTMGNIFQTVPLSWIERLLEKTRPPLSVIVSKRSLAREWEWLAPGERFPGSYFPALNIIWLELEKSHEGRVVRHEIAHAYASTLQGNALKDYYLWKLKNLFRPEEIESYESLLLNKDNAAKLSDFRRRAEEKFVSSYALEGSEGIYAHLENPQEDFAEAASYFFGSLSEGPYDWEKYFSRDPALMTLMGLQYLFDQYGVSKIGNVGKEAVFARASFREVMGIKLDSVSASLFPSDPIAPFLTSSVLQAATGIALTPSVHPYFSARLGYLPHSFGGGLALDFSHSQDLGLWGRLSSPSGLVRFYGELSGGYRHEAEPSRITHSAWAGMAAGVLFFNSLVIGLQGKVDLVAKPGEFEPSFQFGYDLAALAR